ncbi:GNAT family N-acetyltransferase [Aquimarina longa]|uniref:GNAT family N-acetyltransferase n=1 Tax=Aquimarina longa TaxID=1080221 RepID=UPI000783BA2A|nr:GNAT family N-acetyltransferase [Aquimarina longa]
MNNAVIRPSIIFYKTIKGLGDISLRLLDIENDIEIIHNWVTKPYATYWGMQDHTLEEVKQAYQQIIETEHHDTFIGLLNNEPIFLMERYQVLKDPISEYYDAKLGDYGMHILVSPVEKRIPNFTWHVFTTILDYLFSNPTVDRIVVEPDVRNDKIHILNKKAGFVYHKEVELPHKKAALAFCERVSYHNAVKAEEHKNNIPKN